jgi:hypothetical protein
MKTFPLLVAAALSMSGLVNGCSTDPDTLSSSSSGSSSSGDCHQGDVGSGSTTPAELGSCPAMTAAGSSCCDANFEAYCSYSELMGNQYTAYIFRCQLGGWQTQNADFACEAHTSAEWTALNGQACAKTGQVCVHGGDTDGPLEPLIVAVCGGNGLWTVK